MSDGDDSASETRSVSDPEPAARESGDAAADRWIGQLVGERYRIIDTVGTGGMGTVYRAEHVLMKKMVAVKRLRDDLDHGEEVVRRFEREAQSASRLSHEGIVQVMDFGRAADGALFLVMEFLAGESLSSLIARTGPLGVVRSASLMRQILSALEHAHAAGVIHRDLKPDNIMLLAPPQGASPSSDGVLRTRLLDFGIAKVTLAEPDMGGPTLTRAGLVFGTPDYMSPEQATGGTIDARTDLYSCGVILFEMLTGRRPFVADNPVSIMTMHITAEPPMPSLMAPVAAIPGSFDRIVQRAMHKQPAGRYASAAEFLAALDGAMTSPMAVSAPTTRILSVAGTGGEGKPARITLTIDIDNLRSRTVSIGRLLRRLALRGLAILRALLSRGWNRLPVRARRLVTAALVLLALGGAAWMTFAPRQAELDADEEALHEDDPFSLLPGARPAAADDNRRAHDAAAKKKHKKRGSWWPLGD